MEITINVPLPGGMEKEQVISAFAAGLGYEGTIKRSSNDSEIFATRTLAEAEALAVNADELRELIGVWSGPDNDFIVRWRCVGDEPNPQTEQEYAVEAVLAYLREHTAKGLGMAAEKAAASGLTGVGQVAIT